MTDASRSYIMNMVVFARGRWGIEWCACSLIFRVDPMVVFAPSIPQGLSPLSAGDLLHYQMIFRKGGDSIE